MAPTPLKGRRMGAKMGAMGERHQGCPMSLTSSVSSGK